MSVWKLIGLTSWAIASLCFVRALWPITVYWAFKEKNQNAEFPLITSLLLVSLYALSILVIVGTYFKAVGLV